MKNSLVFLQQEALKRILILDIHKYQAEAWASAFLIPVFNKLLDDVCYLSHSVINESIQFVF